MNDSEDKANVETHQIAGHSVEIRRSKDREELRIDGVRTKFFVTEDGYNLDAAAYERPYKTLLEAVKSFLESLRSEHERK
jgi:hypothetical protein